MHVKIFDVLNLCGGKAQTKSFNENSNPIIRIFQSLNKFFGAGFIHLIIPTGNSDKGLNF